MDLTSAAMSAFVALLALNYTVPRLDIVRTYPAVFWTISALDVAMALGMLLLGDGILQPLVRFLIALVMLLHLAQNFATRSRWDAEDRIERLEAEQRAQWTEQPPDR